jgi:hypothetical protein
MNAAISDANLPSQSKRAAGLLRYFQEPLRERLVTLLDWFTENRHKIGGWRIKEIADYFSADLLGGF